MSRHSHPSPADLTGRTNAAFGSIVEDGAFRDSDFMKPFEGKGTAVTVEKGGRVSANVKIIQER